MDAGAFGEREAGALVDKNDVYCAVDETGEEPEAIVFDYGEAIVGFG